MLGTEVAVAAPLGLLAGKVQRPMGRLGETAEQLAAPDPESSIRQIASSRAR